MTWDIADPAAPRPVGPRIPYSAVAVGPGRDLVAVANEVGGPNVTLWDFRDPRAPRAAGHPPVDTATPELAFSPDGATFAVAGGNAATGGLGLWSVTAPDRPRALLTGKLGGDRGPDGVEPARGPLRVRVLAGSCRWAIVDTDGKLTFLRLRRRRPSAGRDGRDPRPGPDRRRAPRRSDPALADDGNLWDLTDRWIPTRLPSRPEGAAAAADVRFVGDSRVLAVARRDGEVDLLDLADPRGHAAVRRVVPAHIGGAAPLPAVALSPNGDRLAAARVEGGAVSVTVADLHDPSRAARLARSRRPTPDSGRTLSAGVAVAFTPSGLLAVRSGRTPRRGPGSLTMWDVADLARPRALGPPVPSDGLMSAHVTATWRYGSRAPGETAGGGRERRQADRRRSDHRCRSRIG